VLFSIVALNPSQVLAAESVAVLELVGDGTIDQAKLTLLTDKVRTELVGVLDGGTWQLMSAAAMDEALAAQAAESETGTASGEVEIGRVLGVQRVVSGTAVQFGTRFTVLLNAHDVGTGTLAGSAEATSETLDGLWDALAPACGQLFGIEPEPKVVAVEVAAPVPAQPVDPVAELLLPPGVANTPVAVALAELDQILKIHSAEERKPLLETFVAKYESQDEMIPDIQPVRDARRLLRNYSARGPVFALWGQMNGGGYTSEMQGGGKVHTAWQVGSEIVFAMAVPMGAPGTPGRNHSFMVHAGWGAAWKGYNSGSLWGGDSEAWIRDSGAQIALGVDQFLARRGKKGNRHGVLFAQGIMINLPLPDDLDQPPWVDADFPTASGSGWITPRL